MINLSYMSPERRKDMVEELKGRLIDIFEDFLTEKGVVLDDSKNPKVDTIIEGEDYDSISERIETTLGNWGLFDDLEIATPAGRFIVFCSDGKEGDEPYAAIDFVPKGSTDIIDLALATSIGDDVVLRVFGDPSNDDCTEEIKYTRKDICQALDIDDGQKENC